MRALLNRDQSYVLGTYRRLPLEVSRAAGCYVYDAADTPYLDFFSGIAVTAFGHCDPEITAAITAQLNCFTHLSNYFATPAVTALAEKLVDNSFASKVFFTNSGTEAVEAAIKLAKKRGQPLGKSVLLSAEGAFHGRSTGGVALTGQDKYKSAFQPLMPGIAHFAYDDCTSLTECVSEDTAAVFIEMIQGEGGGRSLSKAFVSKLVELRRQYGFLIVVDEIQTGLGRTGDLFAYEAYGFVPDLVCVAKALGGGLPLGALLVGPDLENVLGPGDHGSTFGGNPVAASAGNATLEKLLAPGFLEDLKVRSTQLDNHLTSLKTRFPKVVKALRGKGFIRGIDVGTYADAIQRAAFERRLLINVTSGTVIRLLPALNMTAETIDCAMHQLAAVIETLDDAHEM